MPPLLFMINQVAIYSFHWLFDFIEWFLNNWFSNQLFSVFLYFIILNWIVWTIRKFVFLP